MLTVPDMEAMSLSTFAPEALGTYRRPAAASTGKAVSEEAISNLLADVSTVSAGAKPVAIYASKYQAGWWGVGRAEWISTPTAKERDAYPGKKLLGVYRAGAAAPSGKAVIIHCDNDWDRGMEPGLFIRLR